jgi:molybdopterin-binding protein
MRALPVEHRSSGTGLPHLRRTIAGVTASAHPLSVDHSSSPHYRVAAVAALLGVSDDTVRRWVESGRLTDRREGGRHVVDGAEVAALARELARDPAGQGDGARASARNRLTGIVTDVVRDTVMAKVEMQAGPFRIVSLMTREAADELDLRPGVLAVASIKSTNVVVERPA